MSPIARGSHEWDSKRKMHQTWNKINMSILFDYTFGLMGWTTITPSCGLDPWQLRQAVNFFLGWISLAYTSYNLRSFTFLFQTRCCFSTCFIIDPALPRFTQDSKKTVWAREFCSESPVAHDSNFSQRRQMAWWTRVSPPRHRHSSRSSSRGSWTGRSAWRCHRSHLHGEAPPTGGWQRGRCYVQDGKTVSCL